MLHSVEKENFGILGWRLSRTQIPWPVPHRFSWRNPSGPAAARIHAYDPVDIPEAELQLNGAMEYYDSLYAVAEKAEAPMVSTGWPEFSFARSRSN